MSKPPPTRNYNPPVGPGPAAARRAHHVFTPGPGRRGGIGGGGGGGKWGGGGGGGGGGSTQAVELRARCLNYCPGALAARMGVCP